MKKLPIHSTLELIMDALRDECAHGTWRDKLPGARVLAQHLGTSAPTVQKALARLAQEGVLVKPGPRRAYQISPDWQHKGRQSKRSSQKTLLILTHMEADEIPDSSRHTLQLIKSRMLQKGWQVHSQVINFVHVKTPQKAWDQSIQADENTVILTLFGRPAIAEWAARHGHKIIFLGGIVDNIKVPLVAVNVSNLAQRAMDLLVSQGHSKIVLPLNDRTDSFKEKLRLITRQAVESAGGVYSQAYHNPESPYFMPEVVKGMVQTMTKGSLPTAIVCIDWKEMLAVQSCLCQAGLRIPQDVSLVLLFDQPDVEWYEPPLTRFRSPSEGLATAVCNYLLKGLQDDSTISVPAEFIPGKSIAPARK
ncbi:HTH-type transcriptional repressor PurR [Rubritalea halochordaticola]|uniref:HTH-type transcriptional repressor PurR n=1 Tax=Rubritalea halochordaticola TaxID=714537 RepID=A0ABP9V4E4_9BACT